VVKGAEPDQPSGGEPAARGAEADSPTEFTRQAWWQILRRIWTNTGRHNIGFLAAGVAFFGFLSLVPALGLIVMLYGLVADPQSIFDRMVEIIRVVPAQAAMLINDQLSNLIKTAAATHGLAAIPAVAIALYGASGAASGIVSSLNIIYEQEEKRGIVRLTALSLTIAAGVICIAVLGLFSASALVFLQHALAELGKLGVAIARIATWLVAGALASLIIALVYRFGPCRAPAKWRWLSLGSIAATVLWLIGSLLFGWYLSVARYDATYGSLGAVVALVMWLYVSAYALLLGAFLDAEAERQTARDSTTGAARPMGERGAAVADTSAALET
jgi:membrane protein